MKKVWFLLILPLLAPMVLFVVMRPYGVGIAPDSAAYFSVAHHIVAGKVVSAYYSLYSDRSEPMAAWPPIYPLFLALGMILTRALETTVAWILNLLLLGLNLWLAGMIVSRATRSVFAGVAGQMILVLTPEWRSYFTWALSEPLFLLMVNSALLCCWKYIDSSRVRWFTAAALLAGFSGLVRYIGGVYVLALALGLALIGRGSLRERLRDAANFLVLGAVPSLVWSLRNNLRMRDVVRMSDTWADRAFGSLMHHTAHQNSWSGNLRSGIDACTEWARNFAGSAVPIFWASWLAVAITLLAATGVVWAVLLRLRGVVSSPQWNAAALLGLSGFIYFFGLAASLTFLRYNAATGLRYEMPTFTHLILAALILLLATPHPRAQGLLSNARRGIIFAAVAAWVLIGIPRTHTSFSTMFRLGSDGTSGKRLEQVCRIDWFPTAPSVATFRLYQHFEERQKGRSF